MIVVGVEIKFAVAVDAEFRDSVAGPIADDGDIAFLAELDDEDDRWRDLHWTLQAERNTLSHQVFAAYRRSDLAQLQRILDRSMVYEPTILEAARIYNVDIEAQKNKIGAAGGYAHLTAARAAE